MITRKHHSLSHEHLDDVEEEWVGIELEYHEVQDVLLLLAKFILLRIESLIMHIHWVTHPAVHGAHVLIINRLLVFLLLLAWLVSGQLSEEFL